MFTRSFSAMSMFTRRVGAMSILTRRAGVIAWALALAITAPLAAQQMESDLPQPISTSELEHMVTRALIAPSSAWNGMTPPLGEADLPASAEALGPAVRAIIAAIEPLHDAYLAEVLTLRDRELTARLAKAPNLLLGASLGDVVRHERQLHLLRQRCIEAEERFFTRIAELLPEPQRVRGETMRRERARQRHRDQVAGLASRAMTLDVIELVEQAAIPEPERGATDPILSDYELRLISVGRRYTEAIERSRLLTLTALQGREPELMAALRAEPSDYPRVTEIRREVLAQLRSDDPVYLAAEAVRELNQRTLRRVLTALSVEAANLVILATTGTGALDDRPSVVQGADSVTRRLLESSAVWDNERAAIAALRLEWLGRDTARAIERMDLEERVLDLENSALEVEGDVEALAAARAELRAIANERSSRARQLLTSIVSIIGDARASTLGVVLPRDGSFESGIEWEDPLVVSVELEWELDRSQSTDGDRSTARQRERAELSRRMVAPAAISLTALQQPFQAWSDDSVVMDAIAQAHRLYLEEWEGRVMARLEQVAIAHERFVRASAMPGEGPGDVDEALDTVDAWGAAKRLALEAAWSVDSALFEGLQQQIGSPARAPVISAVLLTRLWQMGGGVGTRTELLSEWGQQLEVDIAAWAIDATLPEPARAALLQRVHAERAALADLLRERADTTFESTLQDARHTSTWLLNVEDPRYEAYAAQLAREDRAIELAHTRVLADLATLTRHALDEASGTLQDEERAVFKAAVNAAIYPALCRDPDAPFDLITQLLSDDAISGEERVAVERIARGHRAAHAAATEGMIAAAISINALDPGLSASDRIELQQRRIHEVARWRFERSEANAKARMHLRNELSRATLERIPTLSTEWLRSPQ